MISDFRGSILLPVLVITMIVTATTLGAAYQAGSRIRAAVNDGDRALARAYAQAGIEAAARLATTDPSWRTNRSPGTWLDERELGEGVVTVTAGDPGDGTLAPDGPSGSSDADTLRLESLGRSGTIGCRVRADYVPRPLSQMQNVLFAANSISIGDVRMEGRVRANQNVYRIGNAELHGDITTTVGSSVDAAFDDSDTDIHHVNATQPLPPVDFAWFTTAGERVWPTGGVLSSFYLSADNNPYGNDSPEAIYWIDAGGGDLTINTAVIEACLVIVNVDNLYVRDPGGVDERPTVYHHRSPDPARLPALLVQGNHVTMSLDGDDSIVVMIEGSPTAFESEITGVVMTTGTFDGPQRDGKGEVRVIGAILAHDLYLSGGGDLFVRHDPGLNRNPLVELAGTAMRVVPGSTREM